MKYFLCKFLDSLDTISNYCLVCESGNFFTNNQRVSILGFVSHILSVTATQLFRYCIKHSVSRRAKLHSNKTLLMVTSSRHISSRHISTTGLLTLSYIILWASANFIKRTLNGTRNNQKWNVT